jgi:hypothetical protein
MPSGYAMPKGNPIGARSATVAAMRSQIGVPISARITNGTA